MRPKIQIHFERSPISRSAYITVVSRYTIDEGALVSRQTHDVLGDVIKKLCDGLDFEDIAPLVVETVTAHLTRNYAEPVQQESEYELHGRIAQGLYESICALFKREPIPRAWVVGS